ncbi:alpha/beta fold hydrolase [Kutzneria sp. NPDC051319]|uniref:thioesterase II family protein n=1 Tax=Kutzneria sp. NPDC051319 TaxID=3155047 RepID=UPI00341226B8
MADRWIRTLLRRPEASVNLVCMPHAGGSASFYRGWGEGLPAQIETHVAQYPGREDRIAEPTLRVMADLADAIAPALEPLFSRPVVLFGHSLGASLAYEVALRCERADLQPQLLVVSGSPPPHRRPRKTFHLVDDDALVAELRREAATSPVVLDSPELLEVLLPMVRADYELIETYHPTSPPPVRTPFAVFHGDADPEVTTLQADGWRELSDTHNLQHHQVFTGGHFYLRDHQSEVLAALASLISSHDRVSEASSL